MNTKKEKNALLSFIPEKKFPKISTVTATEIKRVMEIPSWLCKNLFKPKFISKSGA